MGFWPEILHRGTEALRLAERLRQIYRVLVIYVSHIKGHQTRLPTLTHFNRVGYGIFSLTL